MSQADEVLEPWTLPRPRRGRHSPSTILSAEEIHHRIHSHYSVETNDEAQKSLLELREKLKAAASERTPLIGGSSDGELSIHMGSSEDDASRNRIVWALVYLSLAANVVLLTLKLTTFILSHSLAVLASAVDSFLDLVSQLVIYLALKGAQNIDRTKYPAGKSRLEPLGIVVCASLMGLAAFQIIYSSAATIVNGVINPDKTEIPNIEPSTLGILALAILTKIGLFLLCYSYRAYSESLLVLYEDHRNDVMANVVALGTAYLLHIKPEYWWADPVGAILISAYIFYSWYEIAMEQTEFLVGKTADENIIARIRSQAEHFHDLLLVDIVRAYHFGKRYLVELEIVLPGDMPVTHSHDIALALQKHIEEIEIVERAFVHVDYQTRDEDEHIQADSPNGKRIAVYD